MSTPPPLPSTTVADLPGDYRAYGALMHRFGSLAAADAFLQNLPPSGGSGTTTYSRTLQIAELEADRSELERKVRKLEAEESRLQGELSDAHADYDAVIGLLKTERIDRATERTARATERADFANQAQRVIELIEATAAQGAEYVRHTRSLTAASRSTSEEFQEAIDYVMQRDAFTAERFLSFLTRVGRLSDEKGWLTWLARTGAACNWDPAQIPQGLQFLVSAAEMSGAARPVVVPPGPGMENYTFLPIARPPTPPGERAQKRRKSLENLLTGKWKVPLELPEAKAVGDEENKMLQLLTDLSRWADEYSGPLPTPATPAGEEELPGGGGETPPGPDAEEPSTEEEETPSETGTEEGEGPGTPVGQLNYGRPTDWGTDVTPFQHKMDDEKNMGCPNANFPKRNFMNNLWGVDYDRYMAAAPWDEMYDRRVRHTFSVRDPSNPEVRVWMHKLTRFQYEHRVAIWEGRHWLPLVRTPPAPKEWVDRYGERKKRERLRKAAWAQLTKLTTELSAPGGPLVKDAVTTDPCMWFQLPHSCHWIPKPSPLLDQLSPLHDQEPFRNYWVDAPSKHPWNYAKVEETGVRVKDLAQARVAIELDPKIPDTVSAAPASSQ